MYFFFFERSVWFLLYGKKAIFCIWKTCQALFTVFSWRKKAKAFHANDRIEGRFFFEPSFAKQAPMGQTGPTGAALDWVKRRDHFENIFSRNEDSISPFTWTVFVVLVVWHRNRELGHYKMWFLNLTVWISLEGVVFGECVFWIKGLRVIQSVCFYVSSMIAVFWSQTHELGVKNIVQNSTEIFNFIQVK